MRARIHKLSCGQKWAAILSFALFFVGQSLFSQVPLKHQRSIDNELPGIRVIPGQNHSVPDNITGTKAAALQAFDVSVSATYPNTQIDLSWTKNAQNDDVLILWSVENSFGVPQDSIAYNGGDPIPGGGLVLYTGSKNAVSHEKLSPGTQYYYKAFARDVNGIYSTGLSDNAQTSGTAIDKPTNLDAQVTGCGEVTLNWDAPVYTPWSFNEDFESYSDFTTSNVGQWTLIDVDNEFTYTTSSFDYTNEGDTMAYIIFNPSQVTNISNPPLSSDWDAHSGDKYAAAIATPPCGWPGCPQEDWLVSPQLTLPAAGAELRFWAKSVTSFYGLERFTVNVSTTGTNPADFTTISAGSYLQAPTSWTEYVYDLSSYAGQSIYIGIQCISDDAWFFMVDDFSVTEITSKTNAPKGLSAYHLYKNGYIMDTVAAGITTYVDSLAGYSENRYYVVAEYAADSISAPDSYSDADPSVLSGQQTLFEEDFEGSVAGWSIYSYFGIDDWFVQNSISNSGSWAAAFTRINRYNWNLLMSPPIVLNGTSDVTLKYWEYVNRSNQPAEQEVRILLDYPGSGPPYDYNNILITDTMGAEDQWVEKTFHLSGVSDTIYIVWDYFGWNDSDWFIDDVSIEVNQECFLYWTGNTNSDWNVASNWSTNQVPTASDDVLIPSGRPNYPDQNSAGLAETKLLEVDRGATLDIASTDQMTVAGPTIVNGRLTLHSDASGTASMIDNGEISGNGTILSEQYIPSDRWHYISPRAYPEYSYKYIWLYLLKYEEDNGDWGNYITPTNLLLEPGKGYAIWSNSSQTGDTIVYYDRRPISGEFRIDGLSRTSSVIDSLEGFNLVGNPYNSAIDWDAASVTQNNVGDAVHFWDPDANGGLGGYASYVEGVGVPSGTSGIIPPGQGFFVRVNQGATSGSISFDNAARVHNALKFYKSDHHATVELLRLSIVSDIASDETVVRFMDGATSLFDPEHDASKLFANVPSIPQIYSVANTTPVEYLSINSLPLMTEYVSVPIGIRTPAADTYDILPSGLGSFAEAVGILLEDLQNGMIYDLRSGQEVRILSAGGQESNRFLLHFYPSQVKGILHYANQNMSRMSGTRVSIRKLDGDHVYVGQTDSLGVFKTHNLFNGEYVAEASITKPWNGVNATDALLIARHFTGLDNLEGAYYSAADVDFSGFLNTNDALQTQRRYVGQISSFISGDWYVDTTRFSISGEDTFLRYVPVLCYGDVNASNTFIKTQSSVSLLGIDRNIKSDGKTISIPIISEKEAVVSAISLRVSYPSDLIRVLDVGVNGMESLIWNADGTTLSIAALSIAPAEYRTGDIILNILAEWKSTAADELQFSLLSDSEIADERGRKFDNFKLHYPSKVQLDDEFRFRVFPNPIDLGYFSIQLSHELALGAVIQLSDMTGRVLREEWIQGQDVVRMDVSRLLPGVYNVTVSGDDGSRNAKRVIIK